jgi:hypothetical protein
LYEELITFLEEKPRKRRWGDVKLLGSKIMITTTRKAFVSVNLEKIDNAKWTVT